VCLSANGVINSQGTFAQLNGDGGYVSSFCLPRADWAYTPEDDNNQKVQVDPGKVEESLTVTRPCERGSSASLTSSRTACNADGGDGLSRRTGDVQIYLFYIKSVGWWATLIFVVAITGFAFSLSFPSKLDSRFVSYGCSPENHPADDNESHLGGMVGGIQRR